MTADDDPIELPEFLAAGIGTDTKESIEQYFAKILSEANANDISDKGRSKPSNMLEQYRDVFRIKLGNEPSVDVPPLSIITVVDNARAYRSPQRRYAPQQRDSIVQTVRKLEAVGPIFKNPSARWASPALAVPKPGSTKLRPTVDLRGPNARTLPIHSAMSHLDSKFQDTIGSTCFANVDPLTAIGRFHFLHNLRKWCQFKLYLGFIPQHVSSREVATSEITFTQYQLINLTDTSKRCCSG